MSTKVVGLIMGSKSDWNILCDTAKTLDSLKISYDVEVVSAHRTPDKLYTYSKQAREKGFEIIIAGAGGAAHLPGMVAALTSLPVIGVPIPTSALNGLDSLLSIVQMPAGIPVATVAIGKAGAINAAILAASILANKYSEILQNLDQFREAQSLSVLQQCDPREGIIL
jgi:5-(carboxyamino)imidazole ribonucleotide mutase